MVVTTIPLAVGALVGAVVGNVVTATVGLFVGDAVGCVDGPAVGTEVSTTPTMWGSMTMCTVRGCGTTSPYIVRMSVAKPVPGPYAGTSPWVNAPTFGLRSYSTYVSTFHRRCSASTVSSQPVTVKRTSTHTLLVGCAVGATDGAGVGIVDGFPVGADVGLKLGACDAHGATPLPQNNGDFVGSAVVGAGVVGDALGAAVGSNVGALLTNGVPVVGDTVGPALPSAAPAALTTTCVTSITFAGAVKPLCTIDSTYFAIAS